MIKNGIFARFEASSFHLMILNVLSSSEKTPINYQSNLFYPPLVPKNLGSLLIKTYCIDILLKNSPLYIKARIE